MYGEHTEALLYIYYNWTMNSTTQKISRDVLNLAEIVKCLQVYYVPTIIAIGICGCFLTTLVFLRSALRSKFFSHFLAAASISSCGFLLTVLITWLFEQGIDVYAAPGLCQIFVFSSHFFPFLTFWISVIGAYLVVLETVYCKNLTWISRTAVSKTIVVAVALLSFTLYSYKTWTNATRAVLSFTVCTILPENKPVIKVLNMLDVLVLLILPSIIFFVFDMILIYNRLFGVMDLRWKSTQNQEVLKIVVSHSICYHILVTPRAISMLILIINRLYHDTFPQINDILFHKMFQFLFYTYFTVLPILPLFVSKRFRRGLKKTFGIRRKKTRIRSFSRSFYRTSFL